MGKQKPYNLKIEKFNVVSRSSSRSQSTDKHFYLFYSLLVTRRRRRSHTTILIFGGIGTKEAIFASTASARPAATGRVGKVEKAKYNLERAISI